jgi:hypothetical protein
MGAHQGFAVLFKGIVETPPCIEAEWKIHLLFIAQAHNAPTGGH